MPRASTTTVAVLRTAVMLRMSAMNCLEAAVGATGWSVSARRSGIVSSLARTGRSSRVVGVHSGRKPLATVGSPGSVSEPPSPGSLVLSTCRTLGLNYRPVSSAVNAVPLGAPWQGSKLLIVQTIADRPVNERRLSDLGDS